MPSHPSTRREQNVPGWLYYLWTLTWGLGWLPLVAAVVGAVLLLHADPRRALLVPFVPAGFLSGGALEAQPRTGSSQSGVHSPDTPGASGRS